MNSAQHCTRDTHRKSAPDAWPLRDASGRTWAERKTNPQPKGPPVPNKPGGDV